MRAPGNITRLWFVTDRQAAIARGRGYSLRNDVLAVIREPLSVSVNIMRPDWANTHTPPALIICEKYCRHSINVEMMLRISRNARNDVPDKRQHDAIGGRHQ